METATAGRSFFVEHRYVSTGGNSEALVTWADVATGQGTGVYGNSVLVDCTPLTSGWDDAACSSGMSVKLDVGTWQTEGLHTVTLAVGTPRASDGALPVTVTSNAAASPFPTTNCRSVSVTLSDSWGDGWGNTVLHLISTAGYRSLTLDTGRSQSYSVCLPYGTYLPAACGGDYASETSWSAGGLSGTAIADCADIDFQGSTFTVSSSGVTLSSYEVSGGGDGAASGKEEGSVYASVGLVAGAAIVFLGGFGFAVALGRSKGTAPVAAPMQENPMRESMAAASASASASVAASAAASAASSASDTEMVESPVVAAEVNDL